MDIVVDLMEIVRGNVLMDFLVISVLSGVKVFVLEIVIKRWDFVWVSVRLDGMGNFVKSFV